MSQTLQKNSCSESRALFASIRIEINDLWKTVSKERDCPIGKLVIQSEISSNEAIQFWLMFGAADVIWVGYFFTKNSFLT